MRTRFQKLLAVMLSLCLMMVMAPSALASVGDTTALQLDSAKGAWLRNMAVWDDTAYILVADDSDNKIYTYKQGEEATPYTLDGLPADEKDINANINGIFTADGKIYLVLLRSQMLDGDYTDLGWRLVEITLNADGTASYGAQSPDLFDDALLVGDGDYNYLSQMNGGFIIGSKLVFWSYDYMSMFDIATGEYTPLKGEPGGNAQEEIRQVCAYRDGKVLYARNSYDGEGTLSQTLVELDPASGEERELFSYPAGKSASAIAYDAAGDHIVTIEGGAVCVISNEDYATCESVNSMPLEDYGENRLKVLSSGYCLSNDNEQVLVRNLDPNAKADFELKVVNNAYEDGIMDAYREYTDSHQNISVVMGGNYNLSLLDAMMSQSSDADVYIVSASDGFGAVMARGYLASLDGNETIKNTVSAMYPVLQDVVSKNGEIFALPISMQVSGMSYSPKALEKLGMTEADLPSSWEEYVTFLQSLPAVLAEHPDVYAFDKYNSSDAVKTQLMQQVLICYLSAKLGIGAETTADEQTLAAIMDGLTNVDWAGLKLPEAVDDNYEVYVSDEDTVLLQSYASSVVLNTGNDIRSLPMSIKTGDDKIVWSDSLYMAFVNPFSKHQAEAIEFVAALANHLTPMFRMYSMPGENTPIRNAYFETSMKEYDKAIADLQKNIDEAESDADKQIYQESMAEMEMYRDDLKNSAWDADEASIAAYRAAAEHLCIFITNGYDIYNDMFTEMQKYLDGAVSSQQFVSTFLQKLEMSALEGN